MLEADSILAAYNTSDNNRGRFQFYADRTIQFGAQDGHWNDKFFKKLNLNIQYDDGNAGTVADVQYGNLMIVAGAVGNSAAIDVDYGFMIKYSDT